MSMRTVPSGALTHRSPSAHTPVSFLRSIALTVNPVFADASGMVTYLDDSTVKLGSSALAGSIPASAWASIST